MKAYTIDSDWDWADAIVRDFHPDFEAEDSEFHPETGEYSYFDATGNMLRVYPLGSTQLYTAAELEL